MKYMEAGELEDYSTKLKRLCLVYLDGVLMRVVTEDQELLRQIMEHLTFKKLTIGRGKRPASVEMVGCFDATRIEGRTHLMAGAGFLDAVLDICDATGSEAVVTDLRAGTRLTEPLEMEPLKLTITESEWGRLREWQKIAVRYMRVRRNGRFGVPMGGGKSFLLAKVCKFAADARILVTSFNRQQVLDLHRALLENGVSAGIYTSGKKSSAGRVLCCTLGSLGAFRDVLWDIILGDEVHQHVTEGSLEQLFQMKAKRLFGFSGTLDDRLDNADLWAEGIYGPILWKRTYSEAVNDGDVVPVVVRWLSGEGIVVDKCDSRSMYVREKKLYWRNMGRNQAFAAAAKYYVERGKQVLVLAKTTEHLLIMRRLLEVPVAFRSPAAKRLEQFRRMGLIDDRLQICNDKQLQQLQARFEAGEIRCMIANSVWHTGVDFPTLDVLVRVDGQTTPISCAQLAGRLSRKAEGKKFGLVLDCDDGFNETCRRRANTRRRNYRLQGWRDADDNEIAGEYAVD